MKVRPGLVCSCAGHALILAWGLINFSSAKPFDVGPTEALPIEILTPQEFDAMTKGSKTSKKVDAPKVKADKVAEADPEPVDDDTPVAKEDVQAPPPPPAAAPEPAKAEAPPKPEPKPEPKPDPQIAKAEAEKAAKAEAEKAAQAEAAKAAEAKAAQEKAAADKAAKAAAEKAAQEKAEKLAEAAEAERLAKAEAEKEAKQKAEAEKAAAKAQAEKEAKEAKEKAEKLAKAEAEKAAKEKADKLAKAEAEKAAKEKAEAAKAKERKFDPSKIASLLGDKPSSSDSAMKDAREASRKAAAARETAPETTAGTSRGTATKLSMSQRTGIDNAVREQVMQCWNPPFGASTDGSLAVRVHFTLNADGSLAGGPDVTNSSSNPAFRAAADAATRAVRRCSPLKLPPDAYDYWRQVNINFDPKDMMGG